MIKDQPDGGLHVNVPGFCVDLLTRVLGKLYLVKSCVVTPSDLGAPVERNRRLTWLVHKRVILNNMRVAESPTWDHTFVARYHRQCELTFRFWWSLQTGDHDAEVRWAAARATSNAHGKPTPLAMEDALTEVEADWIAKYVRMCPQGASVALSQNPSNQPMHNRGSRSKALHCLLTSCFPTWSTPDKKWPQIVMLWMQLGQCLAKLHLSASSDTQSTAHVVALHSSSRRVLA